MTHTNRYERPQRLLLIFLCMGGAFVLGTQLGQRKSPRVRLDSWVLLVMTPFYVFGAIKSCPSTGAAGW